MTFYVDKGLRPRVYIAGPFTNGPIVRNVRQPIVTGYYLMSRGFAVYIPHLFHFLDIAVTEPPAYEEYMDSDRSWVTVSDALLRLPGASNGADREAVWAIDAGIPVFESIEALCRHFAAIYRAERERLLCTEDAEARQNALNRIDRALIKLGC